MKHFFTTLVIAIPIPLSVLAQSKSKGIKCLARIIFTLSLLGPPSVAGAEECKTISKQPVGKHIICASSSCTPNERVGTHTPGNYQCPEKGGTPVGHWEYMSSPIGIKWRTIGDPTWHPLKTKVTSYTLVIICAKKVPPERCWPDRDATSFQMNASEWIRESVAGQSALEAATRRGIDLSGRYVVVRNIACGAGVPEHSKIGEGHLPETCRDIMTADGHCPSPLLNGLCPNEF